LHPAYGENVQKTLFLFFGQVFILSVTITKSAPFGAFFVIFLLCINQFLLLMELTFPSNSRQ